MTKIYLICSAEAEGDLYRIAQGHFNDRITDRGWRQIKALEKGFAHIQIDKVYTSDLYHACATASAIYKPKSLISYKRKILRENCMGKWEGRNWGNIAYEDAQQLRNFKTAPEKWHVDGAETPQQVLSRMLNSIRQIASENEGKSVAVISHCFAIRYLLAELQGIPLKEVHKLPMVKNTAVSIIEAEAGLLRLVTENDISHLGDKDCQAYEKPYETLDFDTDMYFQPLPWVEYGEIMAEAIKCVWQEAGEDRPFNKHVLLEDAAMLQTIIGFVEQEPAGFLQFGMEPGSITLLCTHPGCRRAGLGVQLIGQAVMAARAKGGDYLRIALPKQNPYRKFFLNYGFILAGENEKGRDILEKNIGLDSEFLRGL